MRKISGLLVLVLATTTTFADSKFSLTGKNTKIEFTGTKAEGKHDGGFKELSGSATIDGTDLTTLKLSVNIDMKSTWSDNEKLTNHLKSPDFFGVSKFPKAKFVSTKVVKDDKGYTITGDLTLTGETKSVSFPAEVSVADDKLTIKGTFKIDRNDFGISYGKGKIDPEVAIKVTVEASKSRARKRETTSTKEAPVNPIRQGRTDASTAAARYPLGNRAGRAPAFDGGVGLAFPGVPAPRRDEGRLFRFSARRGGGLRDRQRHQGFVSIRPRQE